MFVLICLAAALVVVVVAAVIFGLKFIADKIESGLQSILDELILVIVIYAVEAVVCIVYTIASLLWLEEVLPEKLQGIL